MTEAKNQHINEHVLGLSKDENYDVKEFSIQQLINEVENKRYDGVDEEHGSLLSE